METEIVSKELDAEQLKFIHTGVTLGLNICQHYGVNTHHVTSEMLDTVFHSWWQDRSEERISDEIVENALGCLYGNMLCRKHSMVWRVVTDEFGTDLVVQKFVDSGSMQIAPINVVAKRVQNSDEERGFFSGVESVLTKEIKNCAPESETLVDKIKKRFPVFDHLK
jgi:hypothetical protein